MTTLLHKICKRFDFSAEVCPCHFSNAPLQEHPQKASLQHVVLKLLKNLFAYFVQGVRENLKCIVH